MPANVKDLLASSSELLAPPDTPCASGKRQAWESGASRASLLSGEWRGYYTQGRRQYPQRQHMEFADGIVRGTGEDRLGAFHIEGEYVIGETGIRIGWIKTYAGAHSVLYLGTFDGTWILGGWEIGGYCEGFGFAPALSDTAAGDGDGEGESA